MKRESDIIKRSEKHLSKIVGVAAKMKDFIQAFSLNDLKGMEDAYKEIFRLEREADDEKENIIIELSRGPFHPIDREDIMRLVLTMDDIATNIKSSAMKLQYVAPVDVPDEVKDDIVKLTNMVYEIVIRLEEALKGLIEGEKDVLKLADKIERKEEEIDEFHVGLIAKVLNWGGRVLSWSGKAENIGNLLMFKEAVENLEDASDRTEDVADIIRGIVATRT